MYVCILCPCCVRNYAVCILNTVDLRMVYMWVGYVYVIYVCGTRDTCMPGKHVAFLIWDVLALSRAR